MKKRPLSALLALCMVLALLPTAFAANSTVYSDSGSASMAKLTKPEIAQLMELTRLSDPTRIYSTEPGLSSSYIAGSLRQDVLQAGLDRLNALRRIAGLPAVSLDTSYNEFTQAAALVSAVNSRLSRYPTRPPDMNSVLYQQGAAGAVRSNLAAYYGYRPVDGPIAFSVDMWMDDSDAAGIGELGHRRWQLNPAMSKTGFGAVYAADGDSTLYSAEYVNNSGGPSVDYDFIAWPASGNFPAVDRLFHADTAWSVTLNPDKYQTPSKSDLTVTLTRESDGYSWTFPGSESYAAADSGKYFNVDTGSYGVSNCIIFRPDGVERYDGVYTVTVTGLRASGGAAAALSYQVDFFDPDDPAGFDPTPAEPEPTEPEPTEPEAPSFADVPSGQYYSAAVAWAAANGITLGNGDGTFGPDTPCTRAQIVTFLWRAYGSQKPASTDNPFTDVEPGEYYYDAVLWAVENNITSGKTDTAFAPGEPCTRAQAVTFQWRAAGKPAVTGASSFTDVIAGEYYAGAVAWAAANGITLGNGDGSFGPGTPCTRAQIVTFLYRDPAIPD